MIKDCLQCFSPFKTKPSEGRKFCCRNCYKIWVSCSPERNPNYYTCQECGQIGGELNADHIKPFAFYPDLRLDINNGRTLCKGCHMKTPTYLCNSKKSLLDLAPQSKYRGYTKDIQQEENHRCLH